MLFLQLQALEQMVIPPSSTNPTEYPPYQSRTNLGPPQPPQNNPLSPSPVMGVRNQMNEPWQPQSQARPHVPSMNGNMTLLDTNQIPPTSNAIPSTQTLPPTSVSTMQNAPSINVGYGSEDVRNEMNKQPPPPVSLPEVPPQSLQPLREPTTPQNIPSTTQNEFNTSMQSPSTNMPDKIPSSTTNMDMTATNSSGSVSHPTTPTPSSTTDDNLSAVQDSSLPPNTDLLKQDDNSGSNLSQQQPTQTTNSFTDFNCVSSISNYNSGQSTPKANRMDDLMPAAVPVYNQDGSVPNEPPSEPSQPPQQNTNMGSQNLQQPTSMPGHPHSPNLHTLQPSSQQIPTSQNLAQTVTQPAQNQMIQQPNQIPPTPPQMPPSSVPSAPIMQQNAPVVPNIHTSTVSTPPLQNSVTPQAPIAPLPPQITNLTPQNPPMGHTNISNMPPNAQTPNMYDQNAQMMGAGVMGMGQRPMPPHSMQMGMPNMPMGGPPPGMIPGMGMMPGQELGPYQTPISHHQERAALQQQLQELYCMPPAPEHQEKIVHLQERLNILSQHEANDQCNGGPQCILQSPLYNTSMIDSPQVTSTTGRGRGKGTPRAKKPRQKKGDKTPPIQMQNNMTPPMPVGMPPQPLPVSEDCVTPGTGLSMPMGENNELTELGTDAFEMDEKQKKAKSPRKPREPKKPKEPKPPKEPKAPKTPKEPKIPKEKKKKEPKDPKEPKTKRKYVRKKKSDGSDDQTADDSFNKSFEDEFQPNSTNIENEEIKMEENEPESSDAVADIENVEEEIQADSQTPSESILEPGEIPKKDEYVFDDNPPSPAELGEIPRKTPKKAKPSAAAPKKVISTKAKSSKTSSSKKRIRKGTMQLPESDGEGEDLVTTPPPSPPEDPESATHKRRSARNTQRKKYIDDVMLRFSDDESPSVSSKGKKISVPSTPPILTSVSTPTAEGIPDDASVSSDITNKPNFVYINTTDEDSMVVQYVLASRMSKRERKVELKKEIKPEEGDENKDDEEDKMDKEVSEKPEPPPDVVKAETSTNEKDTDALDEIKTEIVDVEEYYVKYRNFSYLHCEWKTEDELYKGDKRIANKIKRFKQKQAQQLNIFENLEEEPFNPDYVEVDRVLDVAEHTDPSTSETVKHYLVKWRSLQYEDSTWELEEDVDPIKIEQFLKFKAVPPKDKWKPKRRPSPETWTKLEKSPIYKGGNSLREYQLEGLNWLLFSWYNGRNCILADEMGLGKTIQSLTFLHAVWEFGVRGPFLVIAPLSTIPNWQREIEGWTDMNVIVYHGSSASRNMIQEYEMFYKNDKGQPIKDLTKFNILITTFEIIVTDFADLKGFNWRICVIDEAHRLKNRNCKLLEGLRQLNLEHRVLLSGTPLQNNVNELFSLLNFLEPQQFPSSETFLQEFGALKTEQEVQKLQLILKPMMLRRLKEDVEKSLAPKEETVVEVELTNIQKKYYRGILERNFSFLSKGTTHANIPNLMNTMMELRKCCIHPYLLNGAEDQIQYDFRLNHGEDPDAYYKALINSSGKMVLIDKLLPKLKANGHRVLIFSQMVRCLDILEDYLMFRKYPYERIDGRIRGNLRQAAIDRFSRPDSDRFVFLLCTKAGGLGINLTAADTVIIYDSDWNPQNDLQAQARCHRIGQQKMVKIYRLLCRNTYEREMFDKASLKLGLDKAILQSMNTSQGGKETGNKQLSKKEIEDLLKKGAYGALLDEENDGDKFCEEDIDMILARRTQVITMESEKGSTFSKASFASSANRSDINIDDPDFWNKWARKADIDTTEKDETEDLVLSEPRRRTQIKRYGHDESAIDMSELESSTDSDPDAEGMSLGMRSRRCKLKQKKKLRSDDYIPRDGERGDIVYGSWARRECFMIERGLLTFGWGRWQEILMHSQLRKGWREQDVEDCARVVVSCRFFI